MTNIDSICIKKTSDVYRIPLGNEMAGQGLAEDPVHVTSKGVVPEYIYFRN